MNCFTPFIYLGLALTTALSLSAQATAVTSTTTATVGTESDVAATAVAIVAPGSLPLPVVHTVTFGHLIYFAAPPPAGWNLTKVLPGSTVRLTLDEDYTGATDISWFHDDVQIATTSDSLSHDLVNFHPTQNGIYQATFRLNGEQRTSGYLDIQAVPFAHAPLANLSARATISPIGPQSITGFVISDQGTALGQKRLVLVRAVGPSLGQNGVAQPLSDPRLRVFDARGELIDPMPAWDHSDPAANTVVGYPSYHSYLTAVMASVGAFPVALLPAADPIYIYELEAGAYTIMVDSLSNSTGDVLTEIYETDLRPSDLISVQNTSD